MADYSGLNLMTLFGAETHRRLTQEYHQLATRTSKAINDDIVLEVPERFEGMVGGRYFGVEIVPAPRVGVKVDEPRWERRNEPWNRAQVEQVMEHRLEATLSPDQRADLDLWQAAVDDAIHSFVRHVEREDCLRGLKADSRCLKIVSKGDLVTVTWWPVAALRRPVGQVLGNDYTIHDWHPMDFGGWDPDDEAWVAASHMPRPLLEEAGTIAPTPWLSQPPLGINGFNISVGNSSPGATFTTAELTELADRYLRPS